MKTLVIAALIGSCLSVPALSQKSRAGGFSSDHQVNFGPFESFGECNSMRNRQTAWIMMNDPWNENLTPDELAVFAAHYVSCQEVGDGTWVIVVDVPG
jgi:hypothetical protein